MELRQTIELLKKQSIQAGLTTAHMQSMGIRAEGVNIPAQVIYIFKFSIFLVILSVSCLLGDIFI